MRTIEDYAGAALRTISLAYKDLQPNEGGHDHQETDPEHDEIGIVEKSGLTLIAIIGIKDIIRPEVPDAVA